MAINFPSPRIPIGSLKPIAAFLVLAVVVLVAGCTSTTRVDAGHVGIRVHLAGSERGVSDMPVVMGWVIYNPVTEQIIQFPTSVQNVVWTASPHEGRTVDESINFSSMEGVNINADLGLSFHIDPMLAPKLYGRFRQNDMLELADRYMRNVVREAFGEVSSKMPVQEIYGVGKSKMLADVTKRVADNLGKDGIIIDQLTFNGSLRLPQNVADAINRAMEATQNAIQSENRVRQVRAEADQAITQAHGQAEATRQKAQGEADALLIRARSEARANEVIRLSTTPAVLQYRALEHWDGKLPTYNGGALPLLTFDASRFAMGAEDAAREKKLNQLLAEDAAKAAAPPPPPPAPRV
ncbi:MAG: prohibitin family protein, partial [Polyangiaceae bacterium]|nr:prohibitin family protein [Polyangiaceae bacterium]